MNGDKLKILFTSDYGITYRGFLGDASTNNHLKNSAFRTQRNNFIGIEANAHLWLNDTHFYINIPYIFGEKVEGLTNGKIMIGAAVSGRMLKDILDKVILL
jgi:hypothetical protein